jgi:hypothetical protein
MFDLIAIEAACGNILNGLKKVFLILPEDVAGETVSHSILPLISLPQLVNGKAMYPVAFDKLSARFLEKKVITAKAGDYYDQTLTFTVKKTRIELDTLSHLLLNRRVHALLVYHDNNTKYVKNLRSEDEADSGDRSAKNEYRFRFIAKSEYHSAHVGGGLPSNITGIIPGPATGDCAIIGVSPDGRKWCITVANNGDLIASSFL